LPEQLTPAILLDVDAGCQGEGETTPIVPGAGRHHLVVLRDEYLALLKSGRKQIECRMSRMRRAPFEAVAPGDLLWFKLPSRPVHAVATAGRCLFRELHDPSELSAIVRQHGDLICAADGFFEGAADWARYISLIWIETVVVMQPMPVYKSDQRAWVPHDQMPYPGMRLGRTSARPRPR